MERGPFESFGQVIGLEPLLAVHVWGVFLTLLGAALIVFNKRYVRWALRWFPWPSNDVLIPRLMTVLMALVLILAGLSAFGIGPGAKTHQ